MEYRKMLYENYLKTSRCVSMRKVGIWVENMFNILYPISNDMTFKNESEFDAFLIGLEAELTEILSCSLNAMKHDVDGIVRAFFEDLPAIKEVLDTDVNAIFLGDPAAQSIEEVVRCYPGIQAIAAYRVAHFLLKKDVPTIPRMITECAHSKTGIDIHPGAEIDKHFFIDHGTGIVIGATAKIGKQVKIYQGVTLGGLSVRKADAGEKRHPSIEDKVVIYAGATILGGDTIIGKNSIIGGNTFITKSVEANSKIYSNATNN